ncbi:hypothetical protein K7X08_015901 [Anisodus acutangulus]|uniref:Uncharacterized protein n=1 Tax=Anisodus acutangulus TaxID=402998 RepID=A0A9Q1LE82_9SOLA|nr:hypothetical protein K7X08_015901 [Anisodus acutangulus]
MINKAINECPHGRLGQTEDVAPVVGFLAGDASEWVNGQIIRVNDGYVWCSVFTAFSILISIWFCVILVCFRHRHLGISSYRGKLEKNHLVFPLKIKYCECERSGGLKYSIQETKQLHM